MKRPKVLFCSIFINIWEKKSRSVKKKTDSLFSFFFLFVVALFCFSSLFQPYQSFSDLPFYISELASLSFLSPVWYSACCWLYFLFLASSESHSVSWTFSSEAFSWASIILPPSLTKSCFSECWMLCWQRHRKNFLPLPLSITLGSATMPKVAVKLFWDGSKSSTENDLSIWAWFYGAQGWKFYLRMTLPDQRNLESP